MNTLYTNNENVNEILKVFIKVAAMQLEKD